MLDRPCEIIAVASGALFQCEPFNGYTRIRTPFLYPDGDVIDLFLRDDGRFHTLTDLGETVRWLNAQTPTLRRTDKQTRQLYDVCGTHGIEFYRGALNLRVAGPESLAASVHQLAQACVRVSDLYFTFRNRAVETVTDEVADFLGQLSLPFERNVTKPGRSGNKWHIDFQVAAPERGSLVQVLTTGTRGASRRLAEHVLAQWVDLSHLTMGGPTRLVSLFDDTLDVWEEADFNLLAEVSDVCYWSQRDEFAQALGIVA